MKLLPSSAIYEDMAIPFLSGYTRDSRFCYSHFGNLIVVVALSKSLGVFPHEVAGIR